MNPAARIQTLLAEAHQLASDHGYERVQQSVNEAIGCLPDDLADEEWGRTANDREFLHEQRRAV